MASNRYSVPDNNEEYQEQTPTPETVQNNSNAFLIIAQQLQELRDRNLNLEQTIYQLQNQNQYVPAPTASSSIRLPEFKMTSRDPPSFSGDFSKKQAHQIQVEISEYLDNCEMQGRMYKFLFDNEPSIYSNQTHVREWISTGLTGIASSAWRQLSTIERQTKTWADFKKWIQDSFSSKLTLEQAAQALVELRQKASLKNYAQNFNDLNSALSTGNVILPPTFLCILFRLGMKDNLRTENALFEIKDNLVKLQQDAERLDDFYWRQGSKQRAKDKGRTQPPNLRNGSQTNNSTRTTSTDGPVPMELGNVQRNSNNNENQTKRKLTDEEKAQYRKNGWCVYCRSKEHAYEVCPVRNKSKSVNTIGGSKSDATTATSGADANPR
jgi:hypothetical protein